MKDHMWFSTASKEQAAVTSGLEKQGHIATSGRAITGKSPAIEAKPSLEFNKNMAPTSSIQGFNSSLDHTLKVEVHGTTKAQEVEEGPGMDF